jgi:MoaA/NifB/PqqE/SkfB family radical SAM enzyme
MNLYTPFKIFHFKEKLDNLPIDAGEVPLPPLHIRLKPTNICNHRCFYCAYRDPEQQLGKDMSLKEMLPREKILEIAEDCVDMGVKAITFSGGGEPLLYPHLAEVAKYLSEGGISIATLTNGSRLREEIADIFAHMGTWVRISIDGWDDKSYAKLRNVKEGEFSKIIANIGNFKKLQGKCMLGVSIIISKQNASNIFELCRRLKEAGADSVKFSPCVIGNDASENHQYHMPFFEKVKSQTNRAVEELADNSFEIYDSYHMLDHKFAKSYDWCPYMQILPIIGADGRVYSCQDKAYNLDCGAIGDLKNQSFKDFWLNGKSKFFKIVPSRDCNHHCVNNHKNKIVLEYLNADKDHLLFL